MIAIALVSYICKISDVIQDVTHKINACWNILLLSFCLFKENLIKKVQKLLGQNVSTDDQPEQTKTLQPLPDDEDDEMEEAASKRMRGLSEQVSDDPSSPVQSAPNEG